MATMEDTTSTASSLLGRRGINPGDRIFRGVMIALSGFIIFILVLLAWQLLRDSWPVWQEEGLSFIWGSVWDVPKEIFGALPFIYGTFVTSIIALVLAAPVAVGAAIFLVEYSPPRYADPVAFVVELLAAIPSVIFGLWGLYVMAPIMRSTIEPFLQKTFGKLPIIGVLFSGPTLGRDYLTAGTILAIMILPTVMAISREIIRSVPDTQREGMLSLGATRWEVVWNAVLPYARTGIIGGVILGLGRALGETMAVTMTIGNSSRQISPSLFTPGYTLASGIANQFNEASSGLYFGAIIGLALILLAISFLTNLAARGLVKRTASGPTGAIV
ncbi:MAG: phosphate ABC transporter permease subunit PstC [Anaerolineae bacterium]